MDLPGLRQYLARINVSCSRTRDIDAGEAQTYQKLFNLVAANPSKHLISYIVNKMATNCNLFYTTIIFARTVLANKSMVITGCKDFHVMLSISSIFK